MHATCMFKYEINICIYIYMYITTILIGFFECFASFLRCFHLKDILHGFVHFAWMFAFFHFNVIFKMNQGVPNLYCILSRFYVEPQVTSRFLTNDFLGENKLRKLHYLGQGSPQLISYGKGYYPSIYQSVYSI